MRGWRRLRPAGWHPETPCAAAAVYLASAAGVLAVGLATDAGLIPQPFGWVVLVPAAGVLASGAVLLRRGRRSARGRGRVAPQGVHICCANGGEVACGVLYDRHRDGVAWWRLVPMQDWVPHPDDTLDLPHGLPVRCGVFLEVRLGPGPQIMRMEVSRGDKRAR